MHGDVTPSNLLVRGGRLGAVLDFGCCAVGDPACDLTIAWTLFDGPAWAGFRSSLSLGSDTWDRGRGWALRKASTSYVLVLRLNRNPEQAGVRFGWTRSPLQVIEQVLADRRSPDSAAGAGLMFLGPSTRAFHDVGGDLSEFPVLSLGSPHKQLERFFGRPPSRGHQDPDGLFDGRS